MLLAVLSLLMPLVPAQRVGPQGIGAPMAEGLVAETAMVIIFANFVTSSLVPSTACPEILYSARHSYSNISEVLTIHKVLTCTVCCSFF